MVGWEGAGPGRVWLQGCVETSISDPDLPQANPQPLRASEEQRCTPSCPELPTEQGLIPS